MPIEFYKEEAGAKLGAGAFGAVTFHKDTSHQVHSIKNCVTLIDSIQLCYELDIINFVIEVCLTSPFGKIGCWRLDKEHTCVHIGADVGLASISVDFCVDWNARNITLKGKACAFGQCTKWDVVLFQW